MAPLLLSLGFFFITFSAQGMYTALRPVIVREPIKAITVENLSAVSLKTNVSFNYQGSETFILHFFPQSLYHVPITREFNTDEITIQPQQSVIIMPKRIVYKESQWDERHVIGVACVLLNKKPYKLPVNPVDCQKYIIPKDFKPDQFL